MPILLTQLLTTVLDHGGYQRNYAGDRLYDIKCPGGGHYTLKTASEITRAIRRAAGDQVSLA